MPILSDNVLFIGDDVTGIMISISPAMTCSPMIWRSCLMPGVLNMMAVSISPKPATCWPVSVDQATFDDEIAAMPILSRGAAMRFS